MQRTPRHAVQERTVDRLCIPGGVRQISFAFHLLYWCKKLLLVCWRGRRFRGDEPPFSFGAGAGVIG
jgi:hypothetical protein